MKRPDVRVGDVWRDNDSSSRKTPPRHMRVTSVGDTHATLENLTTKHGSTVSLQRFKPTSNGYRLVSRSGKPECDSAGSPSPANRD